MRVYSNNTLRTTLAPVRYTVAAEDGSSRSYTVSVSNAANSAKDISSFSVLGISASITPGRSPNSANISLVLPYGVARSALVASFASTGAVVKVGSAVQISGITTNNFTSPVAYNVTAEDGSSQTYTVTVTNALNPAKDMTAFSVSGVAGTISGSTIAVALPFETSLTALPAVFTHTGAALRMGSVAQTSGVTINDYSHPVVDVATAADGSTKQYTVSVTSTYAAAHVTFAGDWEAGITGSAGNWRGIQTVASDRFQRVTNPVRQVNYPAKIEVRPGDDPINSSGERAEVLTMNDANGNRMNETESSGTQYFAFSVRLDPTWQAPLGGANGNKWAIILQLHGPDSLSASPAIAVSVQDQFNISLNSGDLDAATKTHRRSYPFANSNLNLGKWVDLVMKVKFAKDFTGVVTVWRRDEGQTSYQPMLSLAGVPTLQYRSSQGSVGGHYWKHGFYRSDEAGITNVLWLDGLKRFSY